MEKVVKQVKALMIAYIVTGILLLLLSALLFKFNLSKEYVEIGITAIYVIACGIAGYFMGKMTENKKFLWGMLTGALYFVIIVLVSMAVNRKIQSDVTELISTLVICIGSGMLGGMIS